ncbi:MAG TPA: sulfotransferase [Actinomycetota bacterium]|nr:sulfotransferase [Actinomycetota bacterium]
MPSETSDTYEGEMEQTLPQHSASSRPRDTRVKVLYIMGAPRCGSTVLDNILNEIDGFFSAGELRFLWQRLHQERFCGCGKAFGDCEVWSRVLEGLAGDGVDLSASKLMSRQKAISGTWRTWQLLHQIRKGDVSPEIQAHGQLTSTLYQKIRAVTGARVIVDSSKRPWDAALLGSLTDVSPFFIHFIRDPRAMAFSQSKVKANPDRGQPGVMAPTAISSSALQWIRRNLSADAVRRAHPDDRSMVIGYQEFCSKPRDIVEEITALVGEAESKLPFSDDHTVNLGGNHTVSGNPDRYRRGPVPIREDNRWKDQMPGRDKTIVSLMTVPLMHHYSRVIQRTDTGSDRRSPTAARGESL